MTDLLAANVANIPANLAAPTEAYLLTLARQSRLTCEEKDHVFVTVGTGTQTVELMHELMHEL